MTRGHSQREPRTMNTVPSAQQSLEVRFRDLAQRWQKDTEASSSILRMVRHPAYQEIIGMGPAVVPLLLAELKRRPDYWFAALQQITGENPAPKECAGKLSDVTAAWLEWGKRKGLLT